MHMSPLWRVVGVGSPIVDLVARVSEKFVSSIPGAKGGTILVDGDTITSYLARIHNKVSRSPGGSAANTVVALLALGGSGRFLGKVGDDDWGDFYRAAFHKIGGDCSRLRVARGLPTGRCLSLVTPDSERTMRTHLGAAMALLPTEIEPADFLGCAHAHVEGYLLFNRDLIRAVLSTAKRAGCTVSLDLASFEVVEAAKDILPDLLRDYVDIVFANEAETAALTGHTDPTHGLEALGKPCDVAAVKLGADGALIKCGDERVRVQAVKVERPVDTTGAGDLWAAGFLWGYLNSEPLTACGKYGSILGAEAVQHVGAWLPEESWARLREHLKSGTLQSK